MEQSEKIEKLQKFQEFLEFQGCAPAGAARGPGPAVSAGSELPSGGRRAGKLQSSVVQLPSQQPIRATPRITRTSYDLYDFTRF